MSFTTVIVWHFDRSVFKSSKDCRNPICQNMGFSLHTKPQSLFQINGHISELKPKQTNKQNHQKTNNIGPVTYKLKLKIEEKINSITSFWSWGLNCNTKSCRERIKQNSVQMQLRQISGELFLYLVLLTRYYSYLKRNKTKPCYMHFK